MALLWDLLSILLWIGLGAVAGAVGLWVHILLLFRKSGGAR